MTTELSRQSQKAPGQLATAAPIEEFRLLDAFTGGLVEPRQQQPTLATISAGYNANAGVRDAMMKPMVSRDGTIYVNGRENLVLAFEQVPGLARALQENNRKKLTITFPFDDPALFIQQHFTCRSASRLQVYGDHTGLTRIRTESVNPETGKKTDLRKPVHEFYPAGSEEFGKLLEFVKVETSIYFFLAGWNGRTAEVLMPDGLGLYRLRMTSRNSAHGIVNSLKWISQLTGGRFAGVPFDLWHEQMEVPGPDGRRRSVPVWNLIPRPPEALALTSGNFREIFASALVQGEQLKILPPPDQTLEVAAIDGPAYDAPANDGPALEPAEVQEDAPARPVVTADQQKAFNAAMRGGLCDPAQARRRFFGEFGDTVLNDDGPRAAMLREYTKGSYSSLGIYLADCTEGEASNLVAFGKLWLARKAELERPPRIIEGAAIPVQTRELYPASEAPAAPPADEEEPERPDIDLDAVMDHRPSAGPMDHREHPDAEPDSVDLFNQARHERAPLLIDFEALLARAASVGYAVDELDLTTVSNAELDGACNALRERLDALEPGADLTDDEAMS